MGRKQGQHIAGLSAALERGDTSMLDLPSVRVPRPYEVSVLHKTVLNKRKLRVRAIKTWSVYKVYLSKP